MITEHVDSLHWRRHVTVAASCRGGGGGWGLHSPHCNGVKSKGCPHKFNKTSLALHALRAYVFNCYSEWPKILVLAVMPTPSSRPSFVVANLP